VRVLNTAAGLDFGEQRVGARVVLVNALHRTHINAGPVFHVDASLGDDHNARQDRLLSHPAMLTARPQVRDPHTHPGPCAGADQTPMRDPQSDPQPGHMNRNLGPLEGACRPLPKDGRCASVSKVLQFGHSRRPITDLSYPARPSPCTGKENSSRSGGPGEDDSPTETAAENARRDLGGCLRDADPSPPSVGREETRGPGMSALLGQRDGAQGLAS